MRKNKINGDASCEGRSASSWSDPHQAPPTYPEGKYNGRVGQRKLALALVDSRGRLASEYKSDSWA